MPEMSIHSLAAPLAAIGSLARDGRLPKRSIKMTDLNTLRTCRRLLAFGLAPCFRYRGKGIDDILLSLISATQHTADGSTFISTDPCRRDSVVSENSN